FERTALLDVELDVCGVIALPLQRRGELCGIATEETHAVPPRLPACGHEVEVLLGQVTDHPAAPDRASLHVREDDNYDRVASSDAALLQRARSFDRRKHTHVAIVVAAIQT